MSRRGGVARDHGFATTEFVLGVGLLVLPMLLLVTLLPQWSEARLAAATAADAGAAAGAIAVATGADGEGAAREAAGTVLGSRDIVGSIRVEADGSSVTVAVEVGLPSFPLMLQGGDPLEGGGGVVVLGALTTTATSVQLVDPYRGPGGEVGP